MEFILLLFGVALVAFFFTLAILAANLKRSKSHQKKKSTSSPGAYDSRGFNCWHIHKNGTKYDDAGFNYYGYNKLGKNAKGQYNRFHDTKSCEEEGFLSPKVHPISITDHARLRFQERLGIMNYRSMMEHAAKAYSFGRSKRQIRKSSSYFIEEKENLHENVIVLIYNGYIYVFSRDNTLITLYKNDNIPL